MEEIMLILFVDYLMFERQKKNSEANSQSSETLLKEQQNKINIQKSVAFLYGNNNLPKTKKGKKFH